ncbi:MAG: HD domain-containing protein [Betaproteobacteria bacterium]|jgi:(p)ppGpp synthase/HD superfamily hydrolase|nr:HD domain-containing protein [Betaproteobacteria bacterium]
MTDNAKVAEALQLAETAHHGQVDKSGVKYVEHVKAVAQKVRHLGEKYEIVGLLHDSVEDCKDRSIVSFEMIAEKFGEEIAQAVRAMTHEPGESYHESYLPRVMKNPISAQVKRADVAHNYGRLHLLDAQTGDRLRAKYEVFLDRYGQLDSKCRMGRA